MDLLEFVLTTTYFGFRGNIFQQKFGTAMGSPVSPIVANLVMEWLEQQAIATAPMNCKPRLWKRYVDDVLEIVRKGTVEDHTKHINQIDTSGNIKFTHETEDNGTIPFLDTLIAKKTGWLNKTANLQKEDLYRSVSAFSISSPSPAQTKRGTYPHGQKRKRSNKRFNSVGTLNGLSISQNKTMLITRKL